MRLQAELDVARDNAPAALPSKSDSVRRASIVPSSLAPVHVQVRRWRFLAVPRILHVICRQVHGLGLDGVGEGVSVSSARAQATSGHRRGSTALQVCQFLTCHQSFKCLRACQFRSRKFTVLFADAAHEDLYP